MAITGSSIADRVAMRMRAAPGPWRSTRVTTCAAGSRRSPNVTTASTHSGPRLSSPSSRSGTTKSSGWPSIALAAPAPSPAANAGAATVAAAQAITMARQSRLLCMRRVEGEIRVPI